MGIVALPGDEVTDLIVGGGCGRQVQEHAGGAGLAPQTSRSPWNVQRPADEKHIP